MPILGVSPRLSNMYMHINEFNKFKMQSDTLNENVENLFTFIRIPVLRYTTMPKCLLISHFSLNVV